MTAPSTHRQLDPLILRDAIVARLPHRSTGSGQLRWPAIPALIEHYQQTLITLFAGLGRRFDEAESRELRAALARELDAGFAASPYSKLLVEFRTEEPPETGVIYDVKHEVITVSDEYDEWLRTRQPPLFGAHPDAKVISLATALGLPHTVAILDVGAGTGRNTLPLAKAGFRVDAVELAPGLAAVLRDDLRTANVSAEVFEGDALDPNLGIAVGKYQLVVLAEVVASHFRDAGQLRQLFEQASRWLAPSGVLLFSAFLASDGYEPDALAKQASQVFWSCLFTRRELDDACRGLPFMRVSDESTYAFEHQHLSAEAWPPTGWFVDWSRGRDLFELSSGAAPHELRWVVYRRTQGERYEAARWHATSVSLHIRAAWERVFDVAVDPRRAAEIFKSVLPVPGLAQRELSGEPKPGTPRRSTWSDGSVTVEDLIEQRRPLHHAYRWTNTLKGPLALLFRAAESDWTFAPTPTGTTVYWTYRFEPRSRLVEPCMNIVQGAFRRWMRASLQSLRALLES
jgi:SAM-dependent methyltransferase